MPESFTRIVVDVIPGLLGASCRWSSALYSRVRKTTAESGICSTGTAQAMVDLKVYVSFRAEEAIKVGEVVNIFKRGVVHFYDGLS